MQEEVENRTVNLAVTTTRMTARAILWKQAKADQQRGWAVFFIYWNAINKYYPVLFI